MQSLLQRWVAVALFMACAEVWAGDNEFRFIVMSDTHVGQNDNRWKANYDQVVQEIIALPVKPAAVFITGDLTNHGDDESIVNFKAWIRDPLVAAGIPVHLMLGNHDANSEYTPNNTASGFIKKMDMPMYHSVDIQKTHFILFAAVPDGVNGARGSTKDHPDPKANKGRKSPYGLGITGCMDPEQLAWMEKDLQSPASRGAQLNILMDHFPLYGEDSGGYEIQDMDYFGNNTQASTKLKQWMDQYDIDLFLYGHRHAGFGGKEHVLPSGHKVMHSLIHSVCMGTPCWYDPKATKPADATPAAAELTDTGKPAPVAGDKPEDPPSPTPAEKVGESEKNAELVPKPGEPGKTPEQLIAQYLSKDKLRKVKGAKASAIGYHVFDVKDTTVTHYRKIVDAQGGQIIGPQLPWTFVASPQKQDSAPVAK